MTVLPSTSRFESSDSLASPDSLDVASLVFHHLRVRCHRMGGRLSLADLDAVEHAFRLGLPADEADTRGPAASSPHLPFDAAGLLAMLLFAHTSDLAATAFANRRSGATDRIWIKQFFQALAEFLVDHYDPAFPARVATVYAEASRAHGRTISGAALMSGAAGQAAARFCLQPLIEGAPVPPSVMAGFCTRLNAAFRAGAVSSPPPQVSLAEVERWFTLVRQTPRLRSWLADVQQAPAAAADFDDSFDIEDVTSLLAHEQPTAP
jgi:hypothetical protein